LRVPAARPGARKNRPEIPRSGYFIPANQLFNAVSPGTSTSFGWLLLQVIAINQGWQLLGDFALLAGVSRNAIALIETGRLGLSSKLAERISQETGVAVLWLTTNDPSFPMVDFNGQPYRAARFSEAQEITRSKDLKPLALYRDEPEMEICVAAGLLVYILEAARQRNQVPQFQKRLGDFIQYELAKFPELRDEVYQEIREWNER
jgi:transcriptional regulator with XRE-family HTH domain